MLQAAKIGQLIMIIHEGGEIIRRSEIGVRHRDGKLHEKGIWSMEGLGYLCSKSMD